VGKHDSRVRLIQVTGREALMLQLGMVAAAAAGAAARDGGYKLTDRQRQAFTRGLVMAVQALVAESASASAEQLEDAARDLGMRFVGDVLGPPPAAN